MKAAVCDMADVPGVLKYVNTPDPITGPDDILTAVEAIPIRGGDLIDRCSAPPLLPSWVVGYAAVGTVAAVGSNVCSCKAGDRVAAFHLQGSYAKRWVVSAEHTWLIPDDMGISGTAMIPISFATVHHCLFTRGMLRYGETVLIQAAAGDVGFVAVQLVLQAGTAITVVTSGIQREGWLLGLGTDHVVDRAGHNIVDRARQYIQGTSVDFVIDPIRMTLPASLSVLAPEGHLVFVGNVGGGSLTADLWSPMRSSQTLMEAFMGPLFARPSMRASMDDLLQVVVVGRIKVVVDHTLPLANVTAAHEFAEAAKSLGYVVMKP